MTQVKNSDIAQMFRSLPKTEQEAVVNYFNLHNAAIWIYNFLTPEAQEYVNTCIEYSQVDNASEESDE